MMAGDSDIQAHRATYERLIWMLKYGAIAVLVITFAVIWLISGR